MNAINTKTFVKFIIPCYNVADTIGRMLDSILAQSFTGYYIVCVEDCSDDNTLEVLQKYAKMNSNKMTLIKNQQNMGAGESRNIGVQQTQDTKPSEFLWLVDGDDFIADELVLQKIHDFAKENPKFDIINLGWTCMGKYEVARCGWPIGLPGRIIRPSAYVPAPSINISEGNDVYSSFVMFDNVDDAKVGTLDYNCYIYPKAGKHGKRKMNSAKVVGDFLMQHVFKKKSVVDAMKDPKSMVWQWLSRANGDFQIRMNNSVLFATNGNIELNCMKNAVSLVSAYTENLYICPSSKYGYSAFVDILNYANLHNYEYVIYFDQDCFICSFQNLQRLFEEFKAGMYCFAGMPDGNMVNMRQHNTYLINPFLSFFDVKKCIASQEKAIQEKLTYEKCMDIVVAKNKHRLSMQMQNVEAKIDSFEPYYKLFAQYALTDKIMYLNAVQYEKIDNTNTATAVYSDSNDDDNIVCVHAWYSRCYATSKEHRKRIDNIANFAKNYAAQNSNSNLAKENNLCMANSLKVYKMQRYDVINDIIENYKMQSYLEIGVNKHEYYDKISAKIKMSVDPDKYSNPTFNMTSDQFFQLNEKISLKFDIVFIDGLHHSDQLLRDIENALKCLNEGGVIVCHDCLPDNEYMQTYEIHGGPWTGDCWKAFAKYRKDSPYECYVLECDHGCGVIDTNIAKTSDTSMIKDNIVDMTWNDFACNKQQWLNVKAELPLKHMFAINK